MEKERGITITNVDKKKQCDIHVVMWRWYACTFGNKLPFEEHYFIDFDEMKMFSARHSKIYKTDTNKYVSGYDKINAT
jgi:hypothetical protein